MSLDDLDRRLLSALRADGRESVAALARRLDVTRATITSRLDRLVASGVVQGFSVRVRTQDDPDTVRAVTLLAVEGRNAEQVISQLRGLPEIRALHTTNGAWDLVAEISTDSLGSFDRLLGRIRGIAGVVNSESSLLLSSVV